MKRFLRLLFCFLWVSSVQASSFLPMPGSFPGASAATLVFVGAVGGSAFSTTSATYPSTNIGTAAGNRCVVVAVAHRTLAAGGNISGLTIGGVAATLVAVGANGGNGTSVAIFSLLVPTGTSATIIITFSANALSGGIGVYNIGTSTCGGAGSTATTITNGGTMNINIPAGGVGIAVAGNDTSGSATWTGLTEDYDAISGVNQLYTGASKAFASAQSPLAVTGTIVSPADINFVSAAWGP